MGGLSGALGHVPRPGSVDGAVSGQQARGVVALSARVRDGTGEHQAVVELDLSIPWSTGVPTGHH